MKGLPQRMALVVVALVLTGSGCGTDDAGGSRSEVMRHHNWWNFYERGQQRLVAGDYAGAREDFERALGERPGARFGYDHEAWRVRTYGMHFLEGYFPRRELGVACFYLGDLTQARRALEQSLVVTPSGRAKHFLNEVDRRELEGRPLRAPEIELRAGEQLVFTRDRQWTVSGRARAPGLVREVRVGAWSDFIERAEPERAFQHAVDLHPGSNVVTVAVRDLLGRETRRDLVCWADWNPPALAITNVSSEGGTWTLQGVCYDDGELEQVLVQGRPLFLGNTRRGQQVSASARQGARVSLAAVDRVGNRLDLEINQQEAEGSTARGSDIRWAQAGSEGVADAGAETAAPPAYQPRDRLKPYLQLSEQRALVTVYRNEFFVDGRAEDGGGLAEIYLSGEPLLPEELKGKARSFYLARRILLEEGTNELEVAAVDQAGNSTVQLLHVVYQRPEKLRDEFRLRVGLLPLEPGADAATADAIRWTLWEELGRPPARFALLQRDQLQTILSELDLSSSALADPSARLQVGKLLPAELFLFGAVHPHEQGATVYVQVFQSEDSEIIYTDDVYLRSTPQDLERQLSGLARKVEQRFPLLDSRIVRRSGAKAVIDAGRTRGVDRGARFLVLPPGREEEAGRILRAGEHPVELRISSVADAEGTAAIVPPEAGAQVQEGWAVYAR